jgi:4-amino-4-deoxy-L-arabinose transferase-like glycosyltransferase
LNYFTRLRSHVVDSQSLFFALSIGVYLFTRFWFLDRFPIYFFSDEAIQALHASELVKNGFFDSSGRLLPTFFQNFNKLNLGATVYLQIAPFLLFGKSVVAVRGISVLVSLLGLIATSFIMKDIFKSRYWWAAGLFLSITPAWFLHSRTAFETVAMVSFYAMFLYCYLMYRSGVLNYLYIALVFGALSFYSYSSGQMVVVITGLLMLIIDWRYHWQQRVVGGKAIFLLILVIMPFVRYLIENPGENVHHLEILFSYWIQPIPVSEKLMIYFSNYLFGLNPAYWYIPNNIDLPRHIMRGYGHIFLATAPLAVVGLGLILRRLQSPAHRIILVALLAAPTGAAIVGISITRVLVMVIHLTILTVMGLSYCLEKLNKTIMFSKAFASVLFSLLAFVNIYMMMDALRYGPTWFQNYGLGGMQYGGQQVFSEVQKYQQDHPDTIILVSPNWANNVEAIGRFFLSDLHLVHFIAIDAYISTYWPIDSDSLFVLSADDFERAIKTHKFEEIQVEKVLPYPNGQPGFYFARLKYVDNIQDIFAAEVVARHILQEDDVVIGQQQVHIRFSKIDLGQITDVFDGNPETFIRTKEANPLTLDLIFPTERFISGISLRVGGIPTRITVQIFAKDHWLSRTYSRELGPIFANRDVNFDFGETISVDELILKVERMDLTEPIQVHLWEVELK